MTEGTMNKQTKINENAQETKNREEFIMLPTVAFCFKKLMQNAKVRQGMTATVLGVEPEEIADMTGENLEEILKIQQKDLQVEDENKN